MNVEPFSLSLAAPLSTAAGTITEREGFVVEYDHRGETGLGEATPLPGWTESVEECRAALDDASDALDGGDHGAALRELDAAEAPAARHGFATALLDADARADDEPLYRWLGADRRCQSVPVNATVGDDDPDATATAAREATERGFDCLKVKVGARSLSADVERVRELRERVGEDVTLRLDANGAWSRETAEEAFETLAALDVAYVEQPLEPDDLSGHADLAGGAVGVALDETLAEVPVADVLAADAADVLILKPMALGGPGTAHTVATRARSAGVEPVVTTTIDGVVARTAAVHVAAAIPDVTPCGLATAELLATDLGPDPAPVSDGRIEVPQSSGLGVTEVDVDG